MVGTTVSARVNEELSTFLDQWAKKLKISRSELLRQIINLGFAEFRRRKALDQYREGKISLWKAAEVAGLSLYEWIDYLEKSKTPLNIDLNAVEAYISSI